MKDMWLFDTMITPKIITVIYWLLLVVAVLAGVGAMFTGYYGFTFATFMVGVMAIVGGAIGARIWCELLIVMFKIHENLKKLADYADKQEQAQKQS